MAISEAEIAKYQVKLRALANKAKVAEAYKLSSKLHKKHPEVFFFAYYEAVMTAEDTDGLSKAESNRLYKLAATKLLRVMKTYKNIPKARKSSLRNEYLWFSKQHYKQYLHGINRTKRGEKGGGAYSSGVGAAFMAFKYGVAKRPKLQMKWAKRSEKAWLNFFKVDAKWFNSYLFYAMALAFQGRHAESEKALMRAAKIAGKSKNWIALRETRKEYIQPALLPENAGTTQRPK